MADAAQRWDPTVAGGSTGTEEVQATAREQAEQVKDTVRESSTQLSSTARDWMQQEADQRTSAIASQARMIADAMRQTSSRLNEDGQPQAARVTDIVAERVERVAGYLDESDGQRLMSDVKDMARRNPWAFAAAGLAAGFAASRFMKASRSDGGSLSSSARPAPSDPTTTVYGAGSTSPAPGTSGAYGATGGMPPAPGEYRGTYGETGSTGS